MIAILYNKPTRQTFDGQKRRKANLEGAGALGNKCRAGLADTVRERKLETRNKELLDVGAADILRLAKLHNTENLFKSISSRFSVRVFLDKHTWIDRKRAR